MSVTRALSDSPKDRFSKRLRHDQEPDLSFPRVPGHTAPEQDQSLGPDKTLWTPLTRNLRQIRLLRMVDGLSHDQNCLQFRLTVRSLDEVADYHAISYTWGHREVPKKVLVDDEICMVTLNCHQALAQIYQHWKQGRIQSDLVWIDCLCINQCDTDEKNAQVSIIGDIFSKATQVLAFTGAHRDNSELIFESAKEIADFGFACNHDDYLCHDCGLPWTEWVLSLGFDSLQALCIACQKFGERDYWNRVWIVQEVSKASSLSILCGDDILPWKPLNDLNTFLVMDMEEMPSITSVREILPSCEMTRMYTVFAVKDTAIDLDEVFDRFSTSACSDPRDHLYGLLSIITWPEGMEKILPDYSLKPYSLASQVMAHIPFERLPDMLLSFHIGQDDQHMRHLIRQRRSLLGTLEQESDVPESQEIKFRSACGVQSGSFPTCGRLRTNSLGDLTASFVHVMEVDGSPGAMFVSSASPRSPRIPLIQQLEEREWHIDSMSSLSGSTGTYRRLTMHTDLIGLICSGARVDDVLFPLPRCASEVFENGVYIVLRLNHDDIYNIIGQAVILNGYSLSRSNDSSDDLLQAPTFKAQIDLKLSIDDAFVLFAQDYTGQGDEYDEQSRWKRVCTSITSSPVAAARITIQAPTSSHKKDWKDMTKLASQWSPEDHDRMTKGLHVPGYWLACQSFDLYVSSDSEKR